MFSKNTQRHHLTGLVTQSLTDAVTHHQAGRLPEAEKQYRVVIGLQPDHADALRLLGALYLQTKKPDQALPLLRQASKVQPKNPEILSNLGVALRETGQLDDAIACLREAIAINPDYIEALNNLGSLFLDQGRAAEAIPLYQHALRLRPDYGTAMGNLASAMSMVGQYEPSIALFSQALKHLPSEAKYFVGQGFAYKKLGKPDDAFACFQKALLLRDNDPDILNQLGHILRDRSQFDEAMNCYKRSLSAKLDPEVFVHIASCWWGQNNLVDAIYCFEQALKLKPDYIHALVNLGAACWGVGRREEGRRAVDEALRLTPDNVGALINRAIMFYEEGQPEKALELFDRALSLDPQNSLAKWRKSFALLALGQYREGWALYENGLADASRRGADPVQGQLWDGQPMPDKHLLIVCEQGLGDSLQFVRYAAEAKKRVGRLSVLCPKPLLRLFQNLSFVDDVFDVIADKSFDAHIAMMSLPHLFGTTLATVPAAIPYLFVDQALQEKWNKKFANVDGVKIGLVWAGSTRAGQMNAGQVDQRRSIGLERMRVLLNQTKARFYSLQKDQPAEQIKLLGLENIITDYMGEVIDFADTAALIQNLDLVISVDTSVAHLAGGLGKPVWVLSRYDACWRWLKNQSVNPWYPTARVFGQPVAGDWDSVLEAVRHELILLLKDR